MLANDTTAIDTSVESPAEPVAPVGKPKRVRKPKSKPAAVEGRVSPPKGKATAPMVKGKAGRLKVGSTVAMGVVIPGLSLFLSHGGGALLAHGGAIAYGLAAMSFGLMAVVLYVSLPHLAWAVQDITRSDVRASWALAVAFDAVLVLAELTRVGASGAGLNLEMGAMLVTMGCLSAFLNCWAFLRHPGH